MRFVPAQFVVPLVAIFALFSPSAPLFAAPAPPKPAKVAPDPRVWALVKGEGTFVLRFGLPRELEPDFAVTCQPGARLLQFTAEVAGRPFASGEGVALSLSNGKRKMELSATAFLGTTDGNLIVEAAVSLEPRVFDLFGTGDALVLRIPATQPKAPPVSLTFPLAGAKGKLADFERACLERR